MTLRLPPPLERPLTVTRDGERVLLLDGEALVAEARAGDPGVSPPPPPTFEEAAAAARALAVSERPVFDECFVCGTRPEGDGLEIHAGRVPGRDDGLVATTWVAREVRPEIVWAVIDCPGAYSLHGRRPRRAAARPDHRPDRPAAGRGRALRRRRAGRSTPTGASCMPRRCCTGRRAPCWRSRASSGSRRARLKRRRSGFSRTSGSAGRRVSAASAPRATRRPRHRRERGRR